MKPLWNTVIFFLNRKCSVGCRTCNVRADPNQPSELSPEWLNRFFNTCLPIPTRPFSIWTGGEPFFSFESLKIGIRSCKEIGFHAEILTSGVWFDPSERHLEILRRQGPFTLRISLDSEHQKTVPLDRIEQLVKRALSLNIPISFTLRHIPDDPNSVSRARSFIRTTFPRLLEKNKLVSRWIHVIPTVQHPISSGPVTTIGKTLVKGICTLGFKDLVIGDDGRIYPCCGVFMVDSYSWLSLGDPFHQSWTDIHNRLMNTELFRLLQTHGLQTVIDHLDSILLPVFPTSDTPLCSICTYILAQKPCKDRFGPIRSSKTT
jgi:hypothetical protein